MKVKANPRYDVFLAGLGKLKRPFTKWEGLAFRAAPLPHARVAKLLDGQGSLRVGGRWSAAGTFPAVNLSTAPETALKESGASFTYYNFAPSDVRPKVLVGVRLRLTRVLDLVRPRGLRTKTWLGLAELLAEDWRKVNDAGHEAQSQVLGRAVQALRGGRIANALGAGAGWDQPRVVPRILGPGQPHGNPGRNRINPLAQKAMMQLCM